MLKQTKLQIIILCCLLIPVLLFRGISSGETDRFVIEVESNPVLSQEMHKAGMNEIRIRSYLDAISRLHIELRHIDGAYYEATGSIFLPSGQERFVVNGDLEEMMLSGGRIGKIGTLSGSVGDEPIGMFLHWIPDQGKCFVYVSVGTVDQDGGDLALTYGEMFDEMNELVRGFIDMNPSWR